MKELPHIGGKLRAPHRMRVPRKCTERCYLNRVLPALLKKHVSHCIVAVFVNLLPRYLSFRRNSQNRPQTMLLGSIWSLNYENIQFSP